MTHNSQFQFPEKFDFEIEKNWKAFGLKRKFLHMLGT